jgi:hypothetical protein
VGNLTTQKKACNEILQWLDRMAEKRPLTLLEILTNQLTGTRLREILTNQFKDVLLPDITQTLNTVLLMPQ